jgi:hypothetical protein
VEKSTARFAISGRCRKPDYWLLSGLRGRFVSGILATGWRAR